jgi:hypothetical protein
MYFRIIVKQNGVFLFRTSRLHSAVELSKSLNLIEQGISTAFADKTTTIEVLRVEPSQGVTLSQAELTAVLAEASTPEFDPVAATGSAAITAALATPAGLTD